MVPAEAVNVEEMRTPPARYMVRLHRPRPEIVNGTSTTCAHRRTRGYGRGISKNCAADRPEEKPHVASLSA